MTQIIAMTKDDDGVWKYHDNSDAALCMHVHLHAGWEITYLDDWLNTEAVWTDRPNDRLILIRLRQRLKGIATAKVFDNDLFKVSTDALFYAAEAISNNVAGCTLQLLRIKHSESQSNRRKDKGKALSPQQEQRLIARYQFRVANGEKYGAVRDLAADFHTSETTVKNLLKKAQ